ncbi:hypothetical protein HMI54_012647 [Coelomomyces lativittatus]|nr:hypothetical protein HMI54_012647 [Coelomomyces lativittatus]KAJ1501208.1 hypothetical protein HMI56_003375 [Coelomomyces lativittatus]
MITPVVSKTPLHVFSISVPFNEDFDDIFPIRLKAMLLQCAYDDRRRVLDNLLLLGDASPTLFEVLYKAIQVTLQTSPWKNMYTFRWPGNGTFKHGVWVGTSLAASLKLIDSTTEIKQQHYENWQAGNAPLINDWSYMNELR